MDLSPEEIIIILKKNSANGKVKIISCEEIEGSGYVAIGYLSAQKKLCVKYKTGDQIEKLHLFLKGLPESEYHRSLIIATSAFTKEVVLFEKFLNDLRKKIEGHPIPTCYLARDNDKLVLNDLSQYGFSTLPLNETFSVEHCEKVIESLTKLHSESITFEIKNNRKIHEYLPLLTQETIYSSEKNHVGMKAVRVGIIALKEIQKKHLTEYREELVTKVFHYLDNLGSLLGPSAKYLNVLSHSDLWSNNLMFRYDKQDKVQECCIIDFQLASIKPLTYDLQMFINLCTSKDLRDKHYKHLEKYYYDNLSKCLSLEGIDLQKLLPWSSYQDLIKELQPITLAIAPMFLHFVLMPEEIIRDILVDSDKFKSYYEKDRTEFALKAITEFPAYRQRVLNGLIELFEYFRWE